MDSTENLNIFTALTPRQQQLVASLVGRGRLNVEMARQIWTMEADEAAIALNEALQPGSTDAAAEFLKDVGATHMIPHLASGSTTA